MGHSKGARQQRQFRQVPASLTMGQGRVKTYTGLYYLEVRSGSDDDSGRLSHRGDHP